MRILVTGSSGSSVRLCAAASRRMASTSSAWTSRIRPTRHYDDLNLKVNELLYPRVDLEDVVEAHRIAIQRASRRRVRPLASPRYDFRRALDRLASSEDPRSSLSTAIGTKGYHDVTTGIYTTR